VTCKTGFNPCGDLSDPEGSPPEDIPDWLGEAIMAYVGLVLDVSQTTSRQGDAMNLYKRAGDHATAILTPHLRRRGLTFRPIG
jgi:hydrogenase maturation factor